MSRPQHHIPGYELVSYAAGTSPEAISLLIATHLALCPGCRTVDDLLNAVGGSLLEPVGEPVSPDLLARTLAKLDEAPPAARPPTPQRADLPPLPEPLRSLVGDRPWRRIAPAIRAIELPVRFGDQPVVITRLSGPIRVPRHGHLGIEAQLVLGGGFTDGDVNFRRGDVQWVDASVEHSIDIDPDAPCVTLLVREARLVQHTLRGKLFGWMTGT